jgi:hypothetical protein
VPNHYSVKAGIRLDAAATAFASKVGDAFFAATKKDVTVTSAYRGPHEQAAAMYVKMGDAEWNIYADKAALAFRTRDLTLTGYCGLKKGPHRQRHDDRHQQLAHRLILIRSSDRLPDN